MKQSLPHETKTCGAPTKECRACKKRWNACGQCARLYLRTENALMTCPGCEEPRASRYRYSAADKELTTCPMCSEPRPCDRPVKRAGAKCYMHGGASRKGSAHGNFKHGFATKDAPLYLMERYKDNLEDPERQSLHHEIALAKALVSDSLSRLHRGESGEVWKQLQTSFEQLTRAIKGDNPQALNAALTNHFTVIKRGTSDEAARRELREALELTGKLKEKETKRERDLNLMIGVEQFYILMAQTLAIVEKYVPKAEHQQLHNEFEKVMVGEP